MYKIFSLSLNTSSMFIPYYYYYSISYVKLGRYEGEIFLPGSFAPSLHLCSFWICNSRIYIWVYIYFTPAGKKIKYKKVNKIYRWNLSRWLMRSRNSPCEMERCAIKVLKRLNIVLFFAWRKNCEIIFGKFIRLHNFI